MTSIPTGSNGCVHFRESKVLCNNCCFGHQVWTTALFGTTSMGLVTTNKEKLLLSHQIRTVTPARCSVLIYTVPVSSYGDHYNSQTCI